MQEFTQILSNFGFPIALCCYLLLRFEKKLSDLEDANEKMIDEIKRMQEIVSFCRKK